MRTESQIYVHMRQLKSLHSAPKTRKLGLRKGKEVEKKEQEGWCLSGTEKR